MLSVHLYTVVENLVILDEFYFDIWINHMLIANNFKTEDWYKDISYNININISQIWRRGWSLKTNLYLYFLLIRLKIECVMYIKCNMFYKLTIYNDLPLKVIINNTYYTLSTMMFDI